MKLLKPASSPYILSAAGLYGLGSLSQRRSQCQHSLARKPVVLLLVFFHMHAVHFASSLDHKCILVLNIQHAWFICTSCATTCIKIHLSENVFKSLKTYLTFVKLMHMSFCNMTMFITYFLHEERHLNIRQTDTGADMHLHECWWYTLYTLSDLPI